MYISWSSFVEGANRLFDSLAGSYFICGMLILFLFPRLYGAKLIWQTVMEESYMRSIKNLSQESMESLGYAIILIGVVEFYPMVKKEQSETVQ